MPIYSFCRGPVYPDWYRGVAKGPITRGECPGFTFLVVPAIRNLIREDKVAQMYSTIQTGQAHGMQTLDQHLTQLVQRGLISRRDALAKAQNKNQFRDVG